MERIYFIIEKSVTNATQLIVYLHGVLRVNVQIRSVEYPCFDIAAIVEIQRTASVHACFPREFYVDFIREANLIHAWSSVFPYREWMEPLWNDETLKIARLWIKLGRLKLIPVQEIRGRSLVYTESFDALYNARSFLREPAPFFLLFVVLDIYFVQGKIQESLKSMFFYLSTLITLLDFN